MSNKPTIKIGFTDYYSPVDEYFVDLLDKAYNVERDDVNPDYLFFCDENFGTNNLSYDPNKTIKIFFTGENRRLWDYRCHFALTFDHFDTNYHYRLPLYVLDDWTIQKKLGLPSLNSWNPRNRSPYYGTEKTGFCSFIVSNGGNVERNNIFHLLNNQKRVDSAGPLFNNMGHILPKGIPGIKDKLDFMSTRKFNICYENGSWPGYVTEKISQALYADTVPIYWGSPTVALDFNSQMIISRFNFRSDAEMVEYILELDKNDEFYNQHKYNIFGPSISKRRLSPISNDSRAWHQIPMLRWMEDNIFKKGITI